MQTTPPQPVAFNNHFPQQQFDPNKAGGQLLSSQPSHSIFIQPNEFNAVNTQFSQMSVSPPMLLAPANTPHQAPAPQSNGLFIPQFTLPRHCAVPQQDQPSFTDAQRMSSPDSQGSTRGGVSSPGDSGITNGTAMSCDDGFDEELAYLAKQVTSIHLSV